MKILTNIGAFILINLSLVNAENENKILFSKEALSSHEYIKIYKVRKGEDLLCYYFRSDGIYGGRHEEYGSSDSYGTRKYYVRGHNSAYLGVKGGSWVVVVDDENEIKDFEQLGLKCSLVQLAFYLNEEIRKSKPPHQK